MIRTRLGFSLSTALAVVGLIAGLGLVGGCSPQPDAGTVKINQGGGGPGSRFAENPPDAPASTAETAPTSAVDAAPLDLGDSVQARGTGGR